MRALILSRVSQYGERTRWIARVQAALGNRYCRLFHRSISRPVAGKYRCWKCLREFDLKW